MLIPLSDLMRKYKFHPKGVVHIGANEGQEAEAYLKAGIKRTFWVEAIPEVYEKLKKHIARFPFESKAFMNVCLSDEDNADILFHVASNDGQSSSFLDFGTHTKMHPTVKFVKNINVKTKRFDTLIDEITTHETVLFASEAINMAGYDFLNIDVQGAELKVLKGMGEYIKGFKWLYLEVNKAELYKGCPMVEEIDAYLKPFGFKRVETKWTDFGWGDCLMIKQ